MIGNGWFITKKQTYGIIVLAIVIVVLQSVIYLSSKNTTTHVEGLVSDKQIQNEIDSLKQIATKKYEQKAFNPNFLNDYTAAKFGMTIEQIDKLLDYRAQNKYVNSVEEFQQVTGVSNEVLNKMTPYFKFPEWTQKKREFKYQEVEEQITKIDLNTATFSSLVAIKGIGDFYANAILNERDNLNGFVHIDQVDFIKSLRPEAKQVLKKYTFVSTKKIIQKININTASKEEIAKIPYINAYLAREIVVLRSKKDIPLNIEDLKKINSFPLDKLKIIKLYLVF